MGEVYEVGEGNMGENRRLEPGESSKHCWLKLYQKYSVVVLLISTQLEGQKEKCSAQGSIYLVMSRAHEHYIIFLNVNNSCVNSLANQSTGHSLILIVLEVTI